MSIHAVEPFLGDLAAQQHWTHRIEAQPSGKRVSIVGAGPSGLSAGYHLRRRGHAVEIHEAGPIAGSMMHSGLPAAAGGPDARDRRIEAMGVRIVLNHTVEDVAAEQAAGAFDAISSRSERVWANTSMFRRAMR